MEKIEQNVDVNSGASEKRTSPVPPVEPIVIFVWVEETIENHRPASSPSNLDYIMLYRTHLATAGNNTKRVYAGQIYN
jgi:hypothetical protein